MPRPLWYCYRWWYAIDSVHAMTMAPLLMPYIYICPADAINIYVYASWNYWDLLDIVIGHCNLHLASHDIPPNSL